MDTERLLNHAGAAVAVGAAAGALAVVADPPGIAVLGTAGPLYVAVAVAVPAFAALVVRDPAPERYEPVLGAGAALLYGASAGLLAAVGYLLFGGGVPGIPGGPAGIERLGLLAGVAGAGVGGIAFLLSRRSASSP